MSFSRPKFGLILILISSLLSGCSRPPTLVTNLALTPALGPANEPQGTLEDVPALLPRIYLVGEVINVAPATRVTVRWYRGGEPLSTQIFTGGREEGAPYDFLSHPAAGQKNLFAAWLEKEELAWPIGDYKAEVYLGDSLIRTLFFRVVAESETERESRRASVRSLFFGESLENGLIRERQTLFRPETETIYLGIEMIEQPAGEMMRIVVEYLPQTLTLATFVQEVKGGISLFALKRHELTPLLGSSFWKTGLYQASLYLDDLLVQKATFRVS